MSPLTLLGIAWGVLTTVLVAILIYRSTLTMHEDDQLFLDDAEAHMQREQAEIMLRVEKLKPMIRWLGVSSAALLLIGGGLAIYQALSQVQ